MKAGLLPLIHKPAGAVGLTTVSQELHLAADLETPQTNDTNKDQWHDQSGNDRHYNQGAETEKPHYMTNVLNGLPVIDFTSVRNYTDYDAADDPQWVPTLPFTLYILYRSFGTSTTYDGRAIQGVTTNFLMGRYNGKHQWYNGAFIQGPDHVDSQWVLMSVKQDVASAELFEKGTSYGTNANAPTLSRLNFGGTDGMFTERLEGQIAEVAWYSTIHDAADHGQNVNHLVSKWGL